MYIKKLIKKNNKVLNLNFFLRLYFFLSILFSIFFLVIFFTSGFWTDNKNRFIDKYYSSGINYYFKIFNIIGKSIPARISSKYEDVNLNITQSNIIVLEKNRNDILNNKLTGSGDDRFDNVEAELEYLNQKYKITLRIKGDRPQNFIDKDKVSYKVKIEDDESLIGLRKFSLMKPRHRNYIHEWLFHEFSETQNLIKLNYEFIYLKINGDNNGLYVIEENFDSWLIEKNKRRNGPIFSMREEFNENFLNSKFEIYNKNFWKKPINLSLASQALNNLEKFQRGELSLEEVFDLDKWAKYFAIIDLTHTYHGASPRNVKFYYNPITSLIEPIPYDGHRIHINFNKNISNYDHTTIFEKAKLGMYPWRNTSSVSTEFFEDDETSLVRAFFYNENLINKNFYKKYLSALKEITEKKFLDTFFELRKKEIANINSAIYADYFLIDNNFNNKYGPGFYYFEEKDIYERAEIIKKKIEPKLTKINIRENENYIYLTNYDLANLGLKTSYFECEIDNNYSKTSKKIFFQLNLDYKKEQKLNKKEIFPKITRCLLANFSDSKATNNYTKSIDYFMNSNLKISDTNYLDFFKINGKFIEPISNKIIIDKDIIIPKNYTVKINSGQIIKIINNSLILSHSPWIAIGEKSQIEITGEKENFGGGLFINNIDHKSHFSNVRFEYLSGIEFRNYANENKLKNEFLITYFDDYKINNYKKKVYKIEKTNFYLSNKFKLTGSITIYGGLVNIENCEFFKISSEDAVNIISANFFINEINFNQNDSDAIDIDFGDGSISNSTFKNINGDAIDVSGSNVKIDDNDFEKILDKAISVGEESKVEIYNLIGENSYIGIAVKDGSYTKISKINFNNVNFPFAAYQKKSFYDFPYLEIFDEIQTSNFNKLIIKDKNSIVKYQNEFFKEYINKKKIIPLIYNRIEKYAESS